MTERKLMITTPSSYENPADKDCWKYCTSCGRCSSKGEFAKCNTCSGRFDPKGMRHAHPEDVCRCTEGIMQWVTQTGQVCQSRYLNDPFTSGVVKYDRQTDDEVDWNAYLEDSRERMDDPDWDPIQFTDGRSTQRFFDGMQKGNQ